MAKNWRWGILGAGRIAEKFCTALSTVDHAVVYAIASRDRTNAIAYATRFNAVKFYDNYDHLVNDPDVDIIYIATPHAFHYRRAMQCLLNKKAVLCEKPLTLCASHTKALVETARQQQVFFAEGMWTAFMPFMEKVKSLINEAVIGELKYLSADFAFAAPYDTESRLFNKKLGGGSLMDIGVYPLYLATSLMGKPVNIHTASALTATGVDEFTDVQLQYANGAVARLFSSIAVNTGITAELTGTKGRIKILHPWFKATTVTVELNDGSAQEFSTPHAVNGFEYEIRSVMRCLETGETEPSEMPHALTVSISELADEILASAGVNYDFDEQE